MPMSKLKNLILLILVLVNLVLLSMVVPLRAQQKRQQETAMVQMQDLFSEYGLTLDRQTLPVVQTLYTLELTPDPAQDVALAAAQALLGQTVLIENDSTRYLSLYRSSSGRCQAARGGGFEAQLSGYTSVSDPAKEAWALLAQMGLAVDSVSAPVRVKAGSYELTATQQLLGVPVFSSQLIFLYAENRLTAIRGAALFDTATLARVDEISCIGAADALVSFLGSRDAMGWLGSVVTEVTQGYLRAETASAAVVRLIPGWRIVTDTGVFWVNGVTREVSALGG